MRTGATQQSAAASPLITVTVDGTTYKSEGGGGNERVVRVRTNEQAWGGEYIIELDNADETLNGVDYNGKQLTLNMAFTDAAASNIPPLYVMYQENTSVEGKLRLILHCGDVWALIQAHDVTFVNASYNQTWQTVDGLAGRTMPDGTTINDAKWLTLYNALTARSNMTIWEVIQDLATAIGVTITKTDTDEYITTLRPPISVSNARTALRQLMEYTKSYLRLTATGGLEVICPSQHASVYSYDDLDVPFKDIKSSEITIPNRVWVWAFNETGTAWINGEATDTASYTKLGNKWITRNYLIASIDNQNMKSLADLNSLAAGILAKIQGELSQGYLEAPMHCTQELFDKITIVDSRYASPLTITGYVNQIQREYDRGVYKITVYLGGATGGWTPPGGTEAPGLAGGDPPAAPSPISDLTFLPAYLPVVIDGDFYSNAYNKVYWSAGTIKAADGSTFSYSARAYSSALTLDKSVFHYLYYTIGDSTLNDSETFSDAIGADKILIAILLQNPDSSQDKALIVPAKGGRSLSVIGDVICANAITADKIAVTELSAITANMGLLNAGEIRLGTFQSGHANDINYFTGWRLWTESNIGRMAGYQYSAYPSTIQWYSGTDGKLYAGSGNAILSYDGLAIKGTGSCFLVYYGTSYAGKIAAHTSSGLYGLHLESDGYFDLDAPDFLFYGTFFRVTADNFSLTTDYLTPPIRTSDPTASSGRMYYNSSTGEFRICRQGTWRTVSVV